MSFLIENMDSNDMELGVLRHRFEDETCLRRLSVYATVRPDILKSRNQSNRYTSLVDLFQNWNIGQAVEEERVVEDSESGQLDIRDYELQVKGFEIDSRIAPGFRYTARYLGTNEYLFGGEARRLESIGLGYGRRLTFKGNELNFNDSYFWSDSLPNGYAFSINAVREGDTFIIVDANSQEIGSVEVQTVEFPQIEKDTVIEGNDIVKNVQVRFSCLVKLHNHNHSLFNMNKSDFEVVEGIAKLVKEKGSKEAVVKSIQNVFFQSLGKCTLYFDR